MSGRTFATVCSGIGAPELAWSRLGWRSVYAAEIERFPSAVLAHHFPHLENRGDLTKWREWPRATVNVLCGGTPCQDFSIAGARTGLVGARAQLTLDFLDLAGRDRPEWLVWENVPGVLSSNKGRDFGAILGRLGQLGYGFAYRVLDAQYFRVPQRRRRVILVGYLGDWRRAAAVLFERAGLSWDPPPRRAQGQDVAGALGTGAVAGGELASSLTARHDGVDADGMNFVSGTVSAKWAKGGGPAGDEHYNLVTHTLRGEGHDAMEDGTGRGIPLVFDPTQITNPDSRSQPQPGNPCHTLAKGQAAPVIAFAGCDRGDDGRGYEREPAVNVERTGALDTVKPPRVLPGGSSQVRRLIPRECERLQGLPDDWTLVPYRNRPTADAPRYKAIGNSMAVPLMGWVGRRIDLVDALAGELGL